MRTKKLLIIGAGGHGRSVAEAALESSNWNEIHFADDIVDAVQSVNGLPVVGNLKSYTRLGAAYNGVVVAIGNNEIRARILSDCIKLNLPVVSIIHPRAFVSQFAEINIGTTVLAGAAVGANAKIGTGCLINCNTCVDHDCVLDDYVHLGVGVHLAGGVVVGRSAILYAGTCAGYHVEIPEGTTWGPGAALTHSFMLENESQSVAAEPMSLQAKSTRKSPTAAIKRSSDGAME